MIRHIRDEITANPEPYWHAKTAFHDEAEEETRDDVVTLAVVGCGACGSSLVRDFAASYPKNGAPRAVSISADSR